MRRPYWIAAVAGSYAVVAGATCQQVSPETFLDTLDEQDYDHTEHPGLVLGEPTHVEVQFALTHITDISEVAGTLRAIGYFRAWWRDPRLAFNQTECTSQINLLDSDHDRIWTPDLYVDNIVMREEESVLDRGKVAFLQPNGMVMSSIFRALSVSVKFDFTWLPIDRHIAELKVGSFSYDMSEVVLKPRFGHPVPGPSGQGISGNDLYSPVFTIGPVGKLILPEANFTTPGHVTHEGDRCFVTLNWQLSRDPMYHITQVIYPSMLFLMISYLQFWVDGKATPARALLATLPVVIFSGLSNNLYSILPKGAQFMFLAYYLTCSLTLCVLAAMHFALVQYFLVMEARRQERANAMLMAKDAIHRLVKQSKQKGVKMKDLVKRYMPDTLEAELIEDEQEREMEEMQKDGTGGAMPLASVRQSRRASDNMRQDQMRKDGLQEKDLVILRIALKYFEDNDEDKSGDLGISELRKVFTHFNCYVSMPQLAAAACAFHRDRGGVTPQDEELFTMQFVEFAPFMIEGQEYIKMYRVAIRPTKFSCRMNSESPSFLCDQVMRVIYPILLLSLWGGMWTAIFVG